MRELSIALYSHNCGNTTFVANLTVNRQNALVEIRKFCPQISSQDVLNALQDALYQDDAYSWFSDHKFAIRIKHISELKVIKPVQKAQFAYNR